MPTELQFAFPLANGLHARPASHLAEFSQRFQGQAVFRNCRNGQWANLHSVLGLVGTDTHFGDPCRVEIAGADATAARAEFEHFLRGRFVRCEDSEERLPGTAKAGAESAAGKVDLPPALRAAGVGRLLVGQVVSGGVGEGNLQFIQSRGLSVPAEGAAGAGPAGEEWARFAAALEAVRAMRAAGQGNGHGPAGSIWRAQQALLGDPTLPEQVGALIEEGWSAGRAWVETIHRLAAGWRQAESPLLRERVLDLEDIGWRLLVELYGPEAEPAPLRLEAATILVAPRLTPGQFAALEKRWLAGLVLLQEGRTSHTAILARAARVPTLVGPTEVPEAGLAGKPAILDGSLGLLHLDPGPALRRYYAGERAKFTRMETRRAEGRDQPGQTRDGRRVEIAANLNAVEEAATAFAEGAEGIGLVRTELLFASLREPPGEEEHLAAYRPIVEAARGRPVIIRLLDIGGDKPAGFLGSEGERNPALGRRGIRLLAAHPEIARTQFRALWRAAALGVVQVLVPMVSGIEELRLARRWSAEAKAELDRTHQARGQELPLGVMLEVPSAAYQMAELAAEADFFSIGSNDLAQYFFAADRENAATGAVGDPLHPAFFRLLRDLVAGAQRAGRWIGCCGDLAEGSEVLPLLVGLGLNELSVSPGRVGELKEAMRRLDFGRCARMLEQACAGATAQELARVAAGANREELPVLTASLVLSGEACASREEAIRRMVDALQEAGRTADPAAVERAVWKREGAYSTGFGHGLALPHAQTAAVTASTMVVLRMSQPVDWEAVDGQPVDVAILMVMRPETEARAHVRLFSRMSRIILQDEVQGFLRHCADPELLAASLLEQLQPAQPAPEKEICQPTETI